jgi:hypothetical protein
LFHANFSFNLHQLSFLFEFSWINCLVDIILCHVITSYLYVVYLQMLRKCDCCSILHSLPTVPKGTDISRKYIFYSTESSPSVLPKKRIHQWVLSFSFLFFLQAQEYIVLDLSESLSLVHYYETIFCLCYNFINLYGSSF